MKQNKKLKFFHRGFTLIELLVVISVIALLASVVLVSLNNTRYKARYTKALADMVQIGKAAELALSSNSSYPPDSGPNVLPPQMAPFISKWPVPPCSGWTYDWESANGSTWTVQRISLRKADNTVVYYFCVANNGDPACNGSSSTVFNGQGSDINLVASKTITCSE